VTPGGTARGAARRARGSRRRSSRIQLLGAEDANIALGGARLEGVDPLDGRRKVCTTGFVVTDQARTGLITAAHCPDSLSYRDPEGGEIALDFVGQWGISYQDVQVHVGALPPRPLFHAGPDRGLARAVTSWRNRTSTRVGDLVCHRGEASGYSCAPVEFVDYAPPGDLCAGPCAPVWVAVAGPRCRAGDSGGPVFLGSTPSASPRAPTARPAAASSITTCRPTICPRAGPCSTATAARRRAEKSLRSRHTRARGVVPACGVETKAAIHPVWHGGAAVGQSPRTQ
jgi:hypothetical protein